MAKSICALKLKTTFGFKQWLLLMQTRIHRGGSFSKYEMDRAVEKFTKIEFVHSPLDVKNETEVTIRV